MFMQARIYLDYCGVLTHFLVTLATKVCSNTLITPTLFLQTLCPLSGTGSTHFYGIVDKLWTKGKMVPLNPET